MQKDKVIILFCSNVKSSSSEYVFYRSHSFRNHFALDSQTRKYISQRGSYSPDTCLSLLIGNNATLTRSRTDNALAPRIGQHSNHCRIYLLLSIAAAVVNDCLIERSPVSEPRSQRPRDRRLYSQQSSAQWEPTLVTSSKQLSLARMSGVYHSN